MKNITKKITMALFTICMMMALGAGFPASTVQAEQEGNWEYTVINDTEAEITKYQGKETKVTIPQTLNDGQYKVTRIGDRAFENCSKIKSVQIPNSVTGIGNSAFGYCGKLKSIKLPNKLTSIGNGAFMCCTSLTSITIPKGVKKIKEATFAASGLKSIKLPKNLTSIGESAFVVCNSLKSVTIPDKVTKIGDYAFADCINLESVTIGKKVKTIGKNLFRDKEGEGSNKLKTITIKSTCLKSVGTDALDGINAYATIKVPSGKLTAYKKLFNSRTGYKSTMRMTQ